MDKKLMKRVHTLTNGKRIANFSSPHPFVFTDGTILPQVEPEINERLKVTFKETKLNNKGDLSLDFSLSKEVIAEMQRWHLHYRMKAVDVVFCPLPMIVAIREEFGQKWILSSPFRAIRIEDRVEKLISIDKQCV